MAVKPRGRLPVSNQETGTKLEIDKKQVHEAKQDTEVHEKLDKVLLIGIDGLRPDALEAADTLSIDRLISEGAYSNKALAGMHTVSGPGWSNILTGVWEKKHGVKDNSFAGAQYEKYPSFFARLEGYRKKVDTVSLVSWKPIHANIITRANTRMYHPMENGGDRLVTQDAVRLLLEKNPDVLFAYFGNVDETGHRYGFDPKVKQYLAEVKHVDDQIGEILTALQKRPQYDYENWLVLVTTDHGGYATRHGGTSKEERTIFYIASGRDAVRGTIDPPPTQVDIVPTIFKHLKILIDPAWELDGKPAGIK